MKSNTRGALVTVFSLALALLAPPIHAATITIRPTNLERVLRLNGTVAIIRAANANNEAVNANATITSRATGEIDILINDEVNVRAITIVVAAGGALAANVQNLLVIEQTVAVALPDADQAECPLCCMPKRGCFRFWRR